MSQEMERQTSDDFSEEEADDLEMEVKEEGAGGSGFFNQEVAAIIGDQIQIQSVGPAGTSLQIRRSRPKEEKERTKLRERHRRAITARILSGLRRHGNYNLRVRADINDVISALAREAGWVVEPDGTTLPSSLSNAMGSPIIAQDGGQAATTPLATMPSAVVTHTPPLRAISSPSSAISLQNCRLKAVYTPPMSHDKQVMNAHARIPEQDYAGTPYVPVYIMMPIGVINKKCELVNPEGIMKDLRSLKDTNVDGIIVDCWWGIVEAHYPQKYNWDGYKRLFQIVRELKLKLQVVMSFHECRDDLGDDVHIPLPHWITEIGKVNPDIFFTDKDGRRNYECLTWGIDKERVLRGRNAIDVYFDFMRSFCTIFNQYFDDGIISEVRVGLGPCGELRYPSYPIKHGWRYPGIGGFQSYDQYLMKSLRKAAEARGQPNWIGAPLNAGSYNSQPGDTVFFCDGGEYDNSYGRFFLGWYSKILVDHADSVLYLAKVIFQGTIISATIPGIHWWYRTTSHAAELVAGFYNPSNRDGYAPVASIFQKHSAKLNFSCAELHTMNQQQKFPEALSDPDGLMWQVKNAAWDVSIPMACENAIPCYDRVCYNKILENSKPSTDPDGRHISSFTYLRLCPVLMERHNFLEFERFIKRMHGEAVHDLL